MLDRINDFIGADIGFHGEVAEAVLIAVLVAMVALAMHWLVFRGLQHLSDASDSKADNIVVSRLRRPTRFAILALALIIVARELPLLDEIWQ